MGRFRLTQEIVTEGTIPAITGRLFALGSWNGRFRGELTTFARIAEREAGLASDHRPPSAGG